MQNKTERLCSAGGARTWGTRSGSALKNGKRSSEAGFTSALLCPLFQRDITARSLKKGAKQRSNKAKKQEENRGIMPKYPCTWGKLTMARRTWEVGEGLDRQATLSILPYPPSLLCHIVSLGPSIHTIPCIFSLCKTIHGQVALRKSLASKFLTHGRLEHHKHIPTLFYD